jgi:hypothetical protein
MNEESNDCCDDWEKYVPILDGYIVMSSIRSYHKGYPKEGKFRYCPWCGKQRNSGERSDIGIPVETAIKIFLENPIGRNKEKMANLIGLDLNGSPIKR